MDLSVKRSIVLGTVLTLGLVAPASATSAANLFAVTSGIGYLNTQTQPDGQIAGYPGVNAWAQLAYSAAGTSNGVLLNYLKTHAPAAGAAATEWERDILAITGAGQNPYNFGGTNYVAGLRALHTGGQLGSASAVNDDAYGVLALVAARVPATDPALLDGVATILAHQHVDGGFSYLPGASAGSDVDDTAAFLAAVHAAKTAGVANAGLAAAQTSAQSYLLSKQNADGGFLSDPAWGTSSNVSSTAVALIALNSLGLGSGVPATNAAAYLKSTQQTNGSFPYQLPVAQGESGDTFDTAYAVAALAGGTWPQIVYAGALPAATATPSAAPQPSATPTPGTVLGAGTATTLPDVGTWANRLLLALAAALALGTGALVYRRQRRAN